jgi:hemophore-related protein
MTSALWSRNVVAVIVGGLMAAVPLAAPASADPLLDPLINTTCSYTQITAAMKAQSPMLAVQFNNRPDMQANLQQFLAMPVDQRQQQASQQQQAMSPAMQALIFAQIGPQVLQVANTCMNY